MTADDGPSSGRTLTRGVDPARGRWRVLAGWTLVHLGVLRLDPCLDAEGGAGVVDQGDLDVALPRVSGSR